LHRLVTRTRVVGSARQDRSLKVKTPGGSIRL
jgi:hypothetical protein